MLYFLIEFDVLGIIIKWCVLWEMQSKGEVFSWKCVFNGNQQ